MTDEKLSITIVSSRSWGRAPLTSRFGGPKKCKKLAPWQLRGKYFPVFTLDPTYHVWLGLTTH